MNLFNSMVLYYCYCWCLLIEISLSKRIQIEAENDLKEKLFKKYNKQTRPSDSVGVKFSLYLNQIVDLIEQEQMFIINAYLDHGWVDERLRWDPNEHANITLLRIESHLLWKYKYRVI